MNPKTGHVSPQYHVVFDDDFTTVPYLYSDHVPSNWAQPFGSFTERDTDEAYDLAAIWVSTPIGLSRDSLPSISEGGATNVDNTRARGNDDEPSFHLDDDTRISQRERNRLST